jgi:PASTA domain
VAYLASNSATGSSGSDAVTVSGSGFTGASIVTLWLRVAGNGATITPPSGCTLITTINENLGGYGSPQQLSVYYTTTVSSNYAFTIGGGNGTTPTCIAVAHTGRLTSAPTNFATTDSSGSASPVSIPLTGITAATGDDLIWCGCICSAATGGSWVTTAPSGFTKQQEASQTDNVFDGGTSCISTRDNVTAGSTGTPTGSSASSGKNGDYYGVVLALPAAASISVVQSVNSQTISNATDINVSLTGVGSGNTLAALYSIYVSSAGTGIISPPTCVDTTLGTSLTPLRTQNSALVGSASAIISGIYFLPGSQGASGSHTIKTSYATAGFNITAGSVTVMEISGVNGVAPQDIGIANSATASTANGLVINPPVGLSTPSEIVLAVLAQHASPGVSNAGFACAGFTDVNNVSNTTGGLGAEQCYQIFNSQSGNASTGFVWTDAGTLRSQGTIGALTAQGVTPYAQTITSSQNQPGLGSSHAVTAQTVTSSVGTITIGPTKSLSGQTIASAEGTLTATTNGAVSVNVGSLPLTSAEGTVSTTVSGNVTTALSGQALSSAIGPWPPEGISYVLDTGATVTMIGQTLTSAIGAIQTEVISYTAPAQTITSTEGILTEGGNQYTLGAQTITSFEGTITASTSSGTVATLGPQSIVSNEGTIALSVQPAITGQTGTFIEGVISFSSTGDYSVTLVGQTAVFTEGIIAPPLSLDEWVARSLLVNAGLIPVVQYAEDPAVPPGFVISQSVAAGSNVPVNTPVIMVVSRGPYSTPGTATMPNLVGLYWTAATTTMAQNYISEDKFQWQPSAANAGTVIAQSVNPGTLVTPGQIVQLTLSAGPVTVPQTVTVPVLLN